MVFLGSPFYDEGFYALTPTSRNTAGVTSGCCIGCVRSAVSKDPSGLRGFASWYSGRSAGTTFICLRRQYQDMHIGIESTYRPMRSTFSRLKDVSFPRKQLLRHFVPRTVTDITDKPSLRPGRTAVPVDRSAVPQYQVASICTNFHLLAAFGAIPVGIFGDEVVPILADSDVFFGSEASYFIEVLLMKFVRSFQNNETTIFRTVGSHIRNALVQL